MIQEAKQKLKCFNDLALEATHHTSPMFYWSRQFQSSTKYKEREQRLLSLDRGVSMPYCEKSKSDGTHIGAAMNG